MDEPNNNLNEKTTVQPVETPTAEKTPSSIEKGIKKPVYKQWWFWVIIMVALLVIGVIGSGGKGSQNTEDKKEESSESKKEDTKTEERNTSSEASENSQEGTPSVDNDGGYKVGETIVYKDSKVTVVGVTRNFSTGNMFVEPESGKEFIKVDVSFVNTTTSKKSFYTSDWQLQDSSGVIRDIDYGTTVMIDNNFSSTVELAGGGKWSGSMIFEVPAGDTALQLQYKPSIFSRTTVINL